MTERPSSDRSAAAIRAWLLAQCAAALAVPVDSLDPSAPLETLGLGSVQAISIVGDLEERLGRELPATLFWDHPTLEAVADTLARVNGDGA